MAGLDPVQPRRSSLSFSPRRPISKCLFLSTTIQQLTHNARPSLIFSKAIMNINSLRSSKSSYGDPRYLSTVTASDGQPPPLAKALVDGYRDALNPRNGDRSRYNTVCLLQSQITDLTDQVILCLAAEFGPSAQPRPPERQRPDHHVFTHRDGHGGQYELRGSVL